ncbi:MAG: hypothetical protein A2097_06275 [Desulfobacula sp. GWF2_41_7]|nr:MAG: hypothetical protein A2097_06275 [Desulfobacula sp. GWF2_41_7]
MDDKKNIKLGLKFKKNINISFKADHPLNLKFLEILNVYSMNKSDWLRIVIENEWEKLQKIKYYQNKFKKNIDNSK